MDRVCVVVAVSLKGLSADRDANDHAVNWYRTRRVNFEDELAILGRRITIPVLFIQALKDSALPPHLGKSMTKHVPDLTVKQVDTAHWALWERPEEVNGIIATWLKHVVLESGRAGKL